LDNARSARRQLVADGGDRPRNSMLSIDRLSALTGWRPTPLPRAIAAVCDQLAAG
jgi:hypothetical protein